MTIRKLTEIAAWFVVVACTLSVIVYWVLNPHLTQIQVFLTCWPLELAVLAGVGTIYRLGSN